VKKEVTRERFEGFLAWLSPDRDRAGDAYERLRFRLCTFFSQRRCSFADELADETINRVIIKIATESIENKMAYCYGVARNVYREFLRRDRPHVDIDEVTVAAREPEEPSLSQECLDECLAKLSTERRDLLLQYFSKARRQKIELRRKISERLETTQTALRMKVKRAKDELRVCVQECMS